MAKTNDERARAFSARVATILGDNLHSLLVFGSQARGGYDARHGETNVLMIVQDASTDALRPIEALIAEWVRKRGPAPLIFSEREWRDSTDVFPIEIEDMRETHTLLHGADPFVGLTTTPADLRRELEREVRGKLLQLRAEYAAVAPDGRALTRLVIDSVGTFFVLMRATVRLVGGHPNADPPALVRQAAEAAGLDPEAFHWVVDKISGRNVPMLTAYDPIGARYVDELQKLAEFVDGLDGAGPSPVPAPSDATSQE